MNSTNNEVKYPINYPNSDAVYIERVNKGGKNQEIQHLSDGAQVVSFLDDDNNYTFERMMTHPNGQTRFQQMFFSDSDSEGVVLHWRDDADWTKEEKPTPLKVEFFTVTQTENGFEIDTYRDKEKQHLSSKKEADKTGWVSRRIDYSPLTGDPKSETVFDADRISQTQTVYNPGESYKPEPEIRAVQRWQYRVLEGKQEVYEFDENLNGIVQKTYHYSNNEPVGNPKVVVVKAASKQPMPMI